MKSIEECICPKCKSKLLFTKTVLKQDDVKYILMCGWCYWNSAEYNFETEAINNYENEIF